MGDSPADVDSQPVSDDSAPDTAADSDRGDGEGKCRLLAIPAEIRNRIYRDVLVEKNRIRITKEKHAPPGFLRTCKQIRFEARSIYYLENNFTVDATDFDCGPSKSFCKQAAGFWTNYKTTKNTCDIGTSFHGGASWPNLLKWLKAYHQDKVSRYRCHGWCDSGEVCCAASRLFDLVNAVGILKWNDVKRSILIMKFGIDQQVEEAGHWNWTDDEYDD